ncbi:C40 family peptidase [Thiothrix eikelboomii]|uniref:C40 family peptidase n=1 Tax=Thiothrix eikelboomii TaxID=92487 RepID=UPI003BB010FD
MNKSSSLRGVSVCSLGLSAAILGGCAATPDHKPTVQASVVSNSNTSYTIKKASIRTPSSSHSTQSARREVNRQAHRQIQAYQNTDTVSRKTVAVGLTREQYRARFEAEKAARVAEALRLQQAKAEAEERQRITRENAIREEYAQKWEANKAAIRARQAKAKAKRVRQQAEVKVKQAQAQFMVKKVENVIRTASNQIGTPYVWGGKTPGKGFDCSGLVQHSLAQGANVRVPRTAAEQYAASVKVASGSASRGDLVFFRTRGSSVSHVGIYLGNGKFLHAPRKGKTVTVSTISGYWQDRLIGFGRIPGACKLPVPMV